MKRGYMVGKVCIICQERPQRVRQRCFRCRVYLRDRGKERPRDLIGKTHPKYAGAKCAECSARPVAKGRCMVHYLRARRGTIRRIIQREEVTWRSWYL